MPLREAPRIVNVFAMVGSHLVETDGLLSLVARCLGRRTCGVHAQSMLYNTSDDEGETEACHRWGKLTMACTIFEGLLYSLRCLDAYIDKAVRGVMIDDKPFL